MDSGKKHSNQIQRSVPTEEFPTLQWACHSIIPDSNIKGLISGVRKISWFLKTETNSSTHAKMQLVGGGGQVSRNLVDIHQASPSTKVGEDTYSLGITS